MARYVRTDEILKTARDGFHSDFGRSMADLTSLREVIEDTPTAEVVEVRHGEWTHTDMADHWHSKDECSECHYHTYDRIDLSHFNYCPNCGAKMDGGKT